MEKVYTVSEVTYYIENLINDDPYLTDIQIVGEVTDCKERNGHLFFSLKDEFTSIGCVFFGAASRGLNLTDGQTVQANGDVRVYPPRGVYRFQCKSLKILPQRGLLYLKMREIYNRLSKEGIFEKPKRPLPKFPERIGIITSRNSAAYQDVLRTIQERYPVVEIFLYHTGVQGDEARETLIKALNDANREDLDVVIITRGGGSADDLWVFNDEQVVKGVYNLRHPVITGVGHQIDTVFIDLVADYSAHTPTAAAQAAVPDRSQILDYAMNLLQKAHLYFGQKVKNNQSHVENLGKELLKSMNDRVLNRTRLTLENVEKLTQSMQKHLLLCEKRVELLQTKLSSLNPKGILERGYAIIEKDTLWIKKSWRLNKNDELTVRFSDGTVKVIVSENRSDDKGT
ncbi:MAG: exodeoxyribonuclease VII large subunit [Pseudothermotoga sp.]